MPARLDDLHLPPVGGYVEVTGQRVSDHQEIMVSLRWHQSQGSPFLGPIVLAAQVHSVWVPAILGGPASHWIKILC